MDAAKTETLHHIFLDFDDACDQSGGDLADDDFDYLRKRIRKLAIGSDVSTVLAASSDSFTPKLTLLHLAAMRSATNMIEDLCAWGGKKTPETATLDGCRPIHLVRTLAACQILAKVGHHPTRLPGEEDSPLDSLVLRNFRDAEWDEMVPWFLANGATPDLDRWQREMDPTDYSALLETLPVLASMKSKEALDEALPAAAAAPRLRV